MPQNGLLKKNAKNKNMENDLKMNIEFVSYTGRRPNLCSGVLTLKIDGREVRFGHDYGRYSPSKGFWDEDQNMPNLDKFWRSGGCAGFTDNYEDVIEQKPWELDDTLLPEEYKKYGREMIELFNKNVEYGCCGGCL